MSDGIERKHSGSILINCPVCEELVELQVPVTSWVTDAPKSETGRKSVIMSVASASATSIHECYPPQQELLADDQVVGVV